MTVYDITANGTSKMRTKSVGSIGHITTQQFLPKMLKSINFSVN